MRFKKQFPSLGLGYAMKIVQSPINKENQAIAFYCSSKGMYHHRDEILKCCNDNQRIKEAIEKLREPYDDECARDCDEACQNCVFVNTVNGVLDDLLESLKLDGEKE